jgi:plastocyanin
LLALGAPATIRHFKSNKMNIKLQLGSLLALGCAAQVATAGDITGTIKLTGTPAPEKEITTIDPTCRKLHPDKLPTTRFYVTGASSGLGDVVVYVKGITGKSAGASAAPVILDQVGCEYTPYIAAAQTGQKITVKNSDPVLHNVHPTPKNTSAGNKESNKAQLPKGPNIDFVFPAEEMHLRFKCDVHPWMFSYVSVFDHPHFAVTDKDGKFSIKGVPAGKYTLGFAHRKASGGVEVTKEIEVTDAGAVVELAMEAK